MARWLAILVAVLVFGTAAGSAYASPSPTAQEHAVAALKRVNDLRHGLGVRTGREMTPALHDLALSRTNLPLASQRTEAASLLARPTDALDPDYYGAQFIGKVHDYCPASSIYCFHWVQDATSADAPDLTDSDNDGVPNYIEDMAAAFDEVHACENSSDPGACAQGAADGQNWPPPVSDGTAGGALLPANRFDVYLKDLFPAGIYGYASTETCFSNPARCSAYMVMDKDFDRFAFGSETGTDAMKVTAAHEYNHVLQYAIDPQEDTWMFESTATYFEDIVYPSINDYLNYMATWVASTSDPLTDEKGGGGLKMYGSAVWNHFIAGRYNRATILDAWKAKTPAPDVAASSFAPGSYTTAIAAHGGTSFSDEFVRFAAATTEWSQPGQGFPDTYPDITRPATSMVVNGSNANVTGVNHTTFKLRDVPASAGTVPLTLRATMPAGLDGGIALVGRTNLGAVVKQVASTTAGGIQTVTLPAGTYARITAVFVNADTSENGFGSTDWKWTADNKSFSSVALFSGTPPPSPTATTGTATQITQTGATLNGTVNPQGATTGFYFEYGATASYGTEAPLPHGTVGSSSSDTPVSAAVSGLVAATTYHFRVVAEGVNGLVFGADQTFTTAAAPSNPGSTTGTGTISTSPPATTSTTPLPSPATNSAVSPFVLSFTITGGKLASVLRNGLATHPRCTLSCVLVAKLVLPARLAKQLRLKSTIATATGRGGTVLKLRISKKAAGALRRLRKVTFKVLITAAAPDGRKAKLTRSVTLRR